MQINQYEVTVEVPKGYEDFKKLLEYHLEQQKEKLSSEFYHAERNLMLYGTTHPERLNMGDFLNA